MKIIVVYFSLDGNSKYVADKISDYTGADKLRLEPIKEYPTGNVSKYLWGGKSAVFGDKPTLLPYDFNVMEYDVIVIGTPVWAGTFVPPIRTFIQENDLSNQKIAFYACNSGGEADKCFDKLKKELPDCKIVGYLSLTNPGQKQLEENERKIREFCDIL